MPGLFNPSRFGMNRYIDSRLPRLPASSASTFDDLRWNLDLYLVILNTIEAETRQYDTIWECSSLRHS